MSTPLRQSFPATSSTWAAPISVLAVACLLFPGCTDSLTAPEDGQDISTLDVIPDSTTLVQGDTVRLEAIAKGPQGNDVSGSTVTWTSGDTTIATVNSNGVATGQSPGSTTITASAENQESGPLSDQSKIVVAGNLVSGIQPAEYTTDITAIGEAVYVDRDFSIEEVPSRFKGWTYVRTANDDKSIQDASAVALTLTDTATVALAYDKRARVLPNWLKGWTDTGRVLKTTDARHDIFTRAFGPGDATLGGNQSGGAEGARSMYVLFTTRSDSLLDDAGEVGTGSLEVGVSTSGEDQDSDGYVVTVRDSSRSVDPNGLTTFSSLIADEHIVELSGIAPNCSVDGKNPGTVTVEADRVITAMFDVTCTAQTGTLKVTASTTGKDQDSDGYTATVNGSTSTDLGPNGSVTFSDLSEEDHSIELSGIKSNCSVEGSNPRTVTVTAGSTASTTFNVICTSTTGSLSVSATTTGDDPDPDGYTATVGGTTSKDLGPNGSVTFSGLSEGDRQVELSGIASNCSVEGSNPRTITVEAGGTITTTFFVTCEFFFGTRDAVLWEYEEWSLQNASYSGNPFDVIATVTFEHQGSSKSHTTEMFYDGGDTWKFRFTGTKTGTWTFMTSSDDPELDGLGGTVSVSSNLDENDRGFLAKQGNRLAIQVGDGEVKGFLLNQYQINDDGPYKHTHITTFENSTSSKVEAYVTHARERGFTSVYIMLNNNPLEMGAYSYDETSDVNPDLQSFQVLDDIVTTAHEEGMRVHFWRWGDESRKWTPIGLEGGINGTVDQRVTRYFAARLGPLPGWSMGYGFDLAEWTSVSELQVWFDDFQAWLGWEHYLSARAGDLQRSSGLINGYAQGDQELGDFFTDTFPSYSTIAEDLNGDKNTPHLLEERNVLGRWGVDATDTRRLMWRTAIAGGMAGWYGFMNYSDKGPDPVFGGDPGYPNPQELKAHRTFWKNRFLLDLERSNSLTDGHALVSGDNTKYVFYKEGASSIDVDLSGMSGSQPAVAVNTGEPYNEINLGTLPPEQQTINLPANGDWAIAIGKFQE